MARSNGRGGFEFFCCAIPLINAGAYVTVIEIAIVAFLVGVLSLTPSDAIVAGLDVIPTWGKAIVAALGFATCLWQVVGLVSIRRETTKLYHAYVRVTTLLTLAVLGVTIAFLIVAATSHDTAQRACNAVYGALPATTSRGFTSSSIEQNYGDQICNYFIWAQVGAMGGLILLLGLVQLYMCFALRAYGVLQRRATRDYKAVGAGALYDTTPEDSYPLAARNIEGRPDSPAWEEPRRDVYTSDPAYRSQYGGDDPGADAKRYSSYNDLDGRQAYPSSGLPPHDPGRDSQSGFAPPVPGPYGGHTGVPAGYETYPANGTK